MEQITLRSEAGVALVTLNRPEARNAYTVQMSAELSEAMQICDRDDEIRAVVITGKGEHFCVGLDLGSLRDQTSSGSVGSTIFTKRVFPFQIRKPVICAINGTAGGFGIAYPMVCDMRIVAEDATIGLTFLRSGLLPEMGATWILPRLIGMERAAQLLLTGTKITGAQAAAMGLALKAVPKAEVLAEAMAIATDIARNTAPVAAAAAKRMLWSRLLGEGTLEQAILEDRDNFMWSATQPDCREGMTAFLEKRAPQWRGQVSKEFPQFAADAKV
ncbi:MAG: enoyl-CoA hydratase/isomerase family protein [Sphingomonadales bacterium]|nr:enoyl-CoA hydratase/isomerase family protein [Sphingomonadales bacterium]MDE2570786.1 enoyl-CoA hydratase/isomerase family protein [Sphingomonadales bacterium]